MAADMVRPGKTVCDVGTDHAYLPSYLVLNEICPKAVATDIGKGPLQNACKTVKSLDLADKITLKLSDGLWNVGENEADDIVLCGGLAYLYGLGLVGGFAVLEHVFGELPVLVLIPR